MKTLSGHATRLKPTLLTRLWTLFGGRARLSRDREAAKISARVDLVRAEAMAEACCGAIYDGRAHGPESGYAKDQLEDARYYFAEAIAAAERGRLSAEADRLRRRRDHINRIYRSQFRARS